jgi:CrcB protein
VNEALWVALGGAIGSLGRFYLNKWVADFMGTFFPYGTLLINVLGSLVIGLAAGWVSDPKHADSTTIVVTLVMVGLCGGFTTFSSFSLQTWQLFGAGEWMRALLNIGLSVCLCLAATALGFWMSAPAKL